MTMLKNLPSGVNEIVYSVIALCTGNCIKKHSMEIYFNINLSIYVCRSILYSTVQGYHNTYLHYTGWLARNSANNFFFFKLQIGLKVLY